jgi:hypothetical protein
LLFFFFFSQDDLDEGDVVLLDGYNDFFFWEGSQSAKEERNKGLELAKGIMDAAIARREGESSLAPKAGETEMQVVKEGHEPLSFQQHFIGCVLLIDCANNRLCY